MPKARRDGTWVSVDIRAAHREMLRAIAAHSADVEGLGEPPNMTRTLAQLIVDAHAALPPRKRARLPREETA